MALQLHLNSNSKEKIKFAKAYRTVRRYANAASIGAQETAWCVMCCWPNRTSRY